MKFGVSADQEVVRGGGGGSFVRYIRENAEYRFRFLNEYPKGWTSYYEHYSAEFTCSYPCTREKDCPGCLVENEREAKPSRKLLVNAVLVSTTAKKDDRGVGYGGLWKLPAASIEPSIKRAYESKGTVNDRDFTVIRYDDGGRVNYDIEREDPETMDVSKFTLIDPDEALQESYDYRWDPQHRAEKQQEMADAKAKREARQESDQQTKEVKAEETPEPEPEVPYELKTAEERKAADRKKLTVVPDEDEDEPNISVTPAQVRRMSLIELKKLYRQAGFDLPDTEDTTELVDNFFREIQEQ